MSAQNLSTVAADLIESYGNTANNVIDAYRASGERMVGLLEQRWQAALKESRSQLTADVAKNATAAQLAFSVYYSKGLTQTSRGAQEWVSQFVKLAGSGIERLAANASRLEEKTGVTALHTLAQASLPGAAALSKLAIQIEQKSADLASKIAGDDVVIARVKRSTVFGQRRAASAA